MGQVLGFRVLGVSTEPRAKPKGPVSSHRTTRQPGGGEVSHILYHGPVAQVGGEDADACMEKTSSGIM